MGQGETETWQTSSGEEAEHIYLHSVIDIMGSVHGHHQPGLEAAGWPLGLDYSLLWETLPNTEEIE